MDKHMNTVFFSFYYIWIVVFLSQLLNLEPLDLKLFHLCKSYLATSLTGSFCDYMGIPSLKQFKLEIKPPRRAGKVIHGQFARKPEKWLVVL